MEWLISLTGSLVLIALSLIVICFCIVAIVTLAEAWLKDERFNRFKN